MQIGVFSLCFLGVSFLIESVIIGRIFFQRSKASSSLASSWLGVNISLSAADNRLFMELKPFLREFSGFFSFQEGLGLLSKLINIRILWALLRCMRFMVIPVYEKDFIEVAYLLQFKNCWNIYFTLNSCIKIFKKKSHHILNRFSENLYIPILLFS